MNENKSEFEKINERLNEISNALQITKNDTDTLKNLLCSTRIEKKKIKSANQFRTTVIYRTVELSIGLVFGIIAVSYFITSHMHLSYMDGLAIICGAGIIFLSIIGVFLFIVFKYGKVKE